MRQEEGAKYLRQIMGVHYIQWMVIGFSCAGLFFSSFDIMTASRTFFHAFSFLGPGVSIAHPFTLCLAAALIIVIINNQLLPGNAIYSSIDKTAIGLGLLFGFGYVLSATVNGSDMHLAFRLFYYGGVAAVVYWLLLKYLGVKFVVNSYMFGYLVWALLSIFLYILYCSAISEYPPYDRYAWDRFLIYARHPGEFWMLSNGIEKEFLFSRFSGNLNKVSNVAILNVMLCMLLRNYIKPYLTALSFLASMVLLFITFSRGALLMSALSALLILVFSLFFAKGIKQKISGVLLSLLLATPFSIGLSTEFFRVYWTDFSTIERRKEHWGDAVHVVRGERRGTDTKSRAGTAWMSMPSWGTNMPSWNYVFGVGPGSYGLAVEGNENFGTHNLFLDAWLEGGVLSSGILIFIVLSSFFVIWKRFRAEGLHWDNLFLSLSFLTFLGLAVREYSFVYLYSSNHCLLQITILFCLLWSSDKQGALIQKNSTESNL